MCVHSSPTGNYFNTESIDNFVHWAGHIHTLVAARKADHNNQTTVVANTILPDHNYYDNLCYCIYLCSSFADCCSKKSHIPILKKYVSVTFVEDIHIDCNHDKTGRKEN